MLNCLAELRVVLINENRKNDLAERIPKLMTSEVNFCLIDLVQI